MLNLNTGDFYCNGTQSKYINKVNKGSVIDLLLDLDRGSIGFKIDGVYKGLAEEGNDHLKNNFYSYFQTVGLFE
jgi:hypothetical protein